MPDSTQGKPPALSAGDLAALANQAGAAQSGSADLLANLRKVSFLSTFSDKALGLVAAITHETRVAARTVLFREGDSGNALYIIKSGRATISKCNKLGIEVVIATLGPGAIIGDMALIDKQPRSATLTTTFESVFYVINEEDFQRLLYSEPDVTRSTLCLLTDRIRKTNDRLIDYALDNHPDMVILTDTDYRLTDINRQAQVLLKIKPGEPIAESVAAKLRVLLEKVRQRGQDRSPFFWVLMKPEKLFLWIHVNTLKNYQGYLQGYLVELRDITQARDTSRRSLEIASFIIHRLPDLVDRLRSQIALVEASAVTGKDIVPTVRELTRQINKLLAFTELEAGPLRVERRMVCPDAIVADLINFHQGVLAEKEHSIDCVLDFGDGQVMADEDWLRKLVSILLNNAITYSPAASTIGFQTSRTPFGRFRCRIQNQTATAPDQAMANRLFDIRQQLEDFESLRSADFGLELPLARHIVDAHGGSIAVEPDMGDLFSVVFEI